MKRSKSSLYLKDKIKKKTVSKVLIRYRACVRECAKASGPDVTIHVTLRLKGEVTMKKGQFSWTDWDKKSLVHSYKKR